MKILLHETRQLYESSAASSEHHPGQGIQDVAL